MLGQHVQMGHDSQPWRGGEKNTALGAECLQRSRTVADLHVDHVRLYGVDHIPQRLQPFSDRAGALVIWRERQLGMERGKARSVTDPKA